jgi:hypothetical protein
MFQPRYRGLPICRWQWGAIRPGFSRLIPTLLCSAKRPYRDLKQGIVKRGRESSISQLVDFVLDELHLDPSRMITKRIASEVISWTSKLYICDSKQRMVEHRRTKKPHTIQVWLSLVQAELGPQALKDYRDMSHAKLIVLPPDCLEIAIMALTPGGRCRRQAAVDHTQSLSAKTRKKSFLAVRIV